MYEKGIQLVFEEVVVGEVDEELGVEYWWSDGASG